MQDFTDDVAKKITELSERVKAVRLTVESADTIAEIESAYESASAHNSEVKALGLLDADSRTLFASTRGLTENAIDILKAGKAPAEYVQAFRVLQIQAKKVSEYNGIARPRTTFFERTVLERPVDQDGNVCGPAEEVENTLFLAFGTWFSEVRKIREADSLRDMRF